MMAGRLYQTGEGKIQAPRWLVQEVGRRKARKYSPEFSVLTGGIREARLTTVCESALCPNRGHCWAKGCATFMILGDVCTRNCSFCAVAHGKPAGADEEEPARVARMVEKMGLSYAVITSVTRDDLPDGGVRQYAAVIREIRRLKKDIKIEVLIPDFGGSAAALDTVMEAGPDVLGHNVETVPRLYSEVRPGASYFRSLELLARAAQAGITVKSGFMLGLGEDAEEIEELLRHLKNAGVEIVTIGQYLRPSLKHYPVERYVEPEEFEHWAALARELGFAAAASGPLVRSSFMAEELYRQSVKGRAQDEPVLAPDYGLPL